jgi:hypothetical protein
LHDKLSSPDRKRSLSPTEALRRYEEKQNNAEMIRDQTLAERVQKAMISSQRVKLLEKKQAERKAEILKSIEEKLKNAELRHTQYLNQIRNRASNESFKVTEAHSSIYAGFSKEMITRKLEEVEARVLAARIRRYCFDSMNRVL